MTYNPDIHNRRSIRLKGYDYSRAGAYFVTICVQKRECLFGQIAGREMALNDAGRMVERWWGELNNKFPQSETGEYMIMPNHFHGIIVTVGADLRVCPDVRGKHTGSPLRVCPNQTGAHQQTGAHAGAPLPEIVQWFKTMTTNEYIRGVKKHHWPSFPGKLWQRNYYEHIVRDEIELHRIREYIVNNPLQWELDRENPNMATNTRGQTHRSAPTDGNEPLPPSQRKKKNLCALCVLSEAVKK